MLRPLLSLCFVVSVFLAFSEPAAAQRKVLGLGVVIVDPTGLTAQYVYDKNVAGVMSVGWANNSVHLNLDHLWLKPNLVKVDKRPIALYYGVGLRWLSNCGDNKVGARVPVGVQHIFREVPIQIFFEVAPTLNLVPNSEFDLDLALGARYFF